MGFLAFLLFYSLVRTADLSHSLAFAFPRVHEETRKGAEEADAVAREDRETEEERRKERGAVGCIYTRSFLRLRKFSSNFEAE